MSVLERNTDVPSDILRTQCDIDKDEIIKVGPHQMIH